MSTVLWHYTLDYKLPIEGEPWHDKDCKFHTYAADHEQAVQDLYDQVPDVLYGSVTFRLKAPSGARRPDHG